MMLLRVGILILKMPASKPCLTGRMGKIGSWRMIPVWKLKPVQGAPGIHSHRFLPDPNATSHDRCLYLLERLQDIPRPWSAAFHCEVVLLTRQGAVFTSHGICTGQIIPEFRGENGFGYDPIFLVDGTDQTMAELDPDRKNQLSHRGKAALGMIKQLGLGLRQA